MKHINRISWIFVAGASLLIASCVKDPFQQEVPMAFDEGEVAFRIGSVSTKSGAAARSEILDIATVQLGEDQALFLQDEITSLDAPAASAATKGTPAFTENVAALYGSFRTVALALDGSSAFQIDPGKAGVLFEPSNKEDSDAYWYFNYKENWKDKLPTYYFMQMPAEQTGVTLDPDEPFDVETGAIKFSYTSPGSETPGMDATAQQDILFTSHKRTEEQKNGETITFYHALTGVKFANFFNYGLNEGAYAKAETIIKKITITGLHNTGTCVVTPADGEDNGKSAAAAVWSDVNGSATFTQEIAYDFADYSQSAHDLSQLNETASKQNLNDKDGSLTFWFIPQEIPEDATITVVFDVSLKTLENGTVASTDLTFEDKTLTINLHDALGEGHRTWKAGELHTFTLWPTAVGVKITDTMNDAKTEKTDVVVKNTGNTWQYVRVNIVGNWVGQIQKSANTLDLSGETILMGYATETGDTETDPWNDKDGYTTYGTFVNLTPRSSTTSPTVQNNWVRFDKYYYYIKAIGPNDAITEPIFDSYTIGQTPAFWIADLWGIRRQAQNVHLEMDLMVEAIEAPTDAEGNLLYPDGKPIGDNTDGYMKAWAAALGLDSVSGLDDLK